MKQQKVLKFHWLTGNTSQTECSKHTGGNQMIDQCIRIVCAELRRRKNNRMEGNIVLGHEFIMDDLFAILPPAFPFFCIASRDAKVANGCIKPHVKDLFRYKFQEYHKSCNKKYPSTVLVTLSVYPSRGTGVPHFKSRVIQRGFKPSFTQELAITRAL